MFLTGFRVTIYKPVLERIAFVCPEEVIMCICGLHVEEGLMVQCGACGAWQHARCMRVADTRAPHHCHHCPRPQQLPPAKVTPPATPRLNILFLLQC